MFCVGVVTPVCAPNLDGLGVLFDMRNGNFCVKWYWGTCVLGYVTWAYKSAVVLTVDVTFVTCS